MIGIFDILFEVLPYLIWGAGPFCVFKGMGTGKDSGKLLFKKIYSDGGVTITENSTNLDIVATGGGSGEQAIRDCEIAFGCGTGITSSSSERFKVEPSLRSLYNLRMFGIDSSDSASYNDFNTSLITGGYNNLIYSDSKPNAIFNSNIVAGKNNRLYRTSNSLCDSSIIASYQSRIYSYSQNTIVSSFAYINESRRSSIISSNAQTSISSSKNSTILASSQATTSRSCSSVILGARKLVTNSSRNTFSSGSSNNIDSSFYSTAINGTNNCIQCSSCIMSILNGYKNYLSRDQQTGVGNSSIINGFSNLMTNPNLPQSPCDGIVTSTILIGYCNYIKLESGGRLDSVRDSIIANGKCNKLTLDNTSFTQSTAILNGSKNCFDYSASSGLANGVIINGECNCVKGGMLNTVLSGHCGYIKSGFNRSTDYYTNRLYKGNLISTSYKAQSSYICSIGSVIITKSKNQNNLFSGVGVNCISGPAGVTGSSNLILGTNLERTEISSIDEPLNGNTILSNHSNNCIVGSSSNSLIISYKNSCLVNCNCTCTNGNGTITAPKSNFNSVIISNNSRISNGINSVIIGGSEHKMQTTKESVIIGGASNSVNGFQAGRAGFFAPLYYTYWKSSGIIGGCNNILNSENIGARQGCGVFLVGLENKIARYTNNCVAVPSICVSGMSLFNPLCITPKEDGLSSGQFSLPLTSLCLRNGIIINWTQ